MTSVNVTQLLLLISNLFSVARQIISLPLSKGLFIRLLSKITKKAPKNFVPHLPCSEIYLEKVLALVCLWELLAPMSPKTYTHRIQSDSAPSGDGPYGTHVAVVHTKDSWASSVISFGHSQWSKYGRGQDDRFSSFQLLQSRLPP